MKRPHRFMNSSSNRKIACTVSAAALMLGVSTAATIGLHFQENYCGSPAYSGYPVTMTAFGIETNGWENLLQMNTGYSSCGLTNAPYGYTLNETIDTTTSTDGLNPLPNGSLNVTWWGPTANCSGFGGYAFAPPHYNYGGAYPAGTQPTGEGEIYATFLRDGVNYGPSPAGGGPNNDQPGYWVDITGLKTLFTNTPFVVELIASADSMETLTNAFVIDMTHSTTNSVAYTNTPPVANEGDSPYSYIRGEGGGLSTASDPITNADHIYITSAPPQHDLVNGRPGRFDSAERLCHRGAAALVSVAPEWGNHPRRDQLDLRDFQCEPGQRRGFRSGGHQCLRRHYQPGFDRDRGPDHAKPDLERRL